MAGTFRVEIVTPYRVFFTGTAESVVFRSVDGDFELLADHEPVVAPVEIAPIRILTDGTWKTAAVTEGFIEMEGNMLTMLVGAALWPEEIDVERVERALKRAKDRLQGSPVDWEKARSTKAVKRANVRLAVAALARGESGIRG